MKLFHFLGAKARQALPTAEDLSATVTRIVRENHSGSSQPFRTSAPVRTLKAHLSRSRTAFWIILAAATGSSCSQILMTCQPASLRRLSVSASRALFPSILVIQNSEFFCAGL
jgi:hypothetical protein